MPLPTESTACDGKPSRGAGASRRIFVRRDSSTGSGQGTLEYALLIVAFMALAAGCFALWKCASSGVFADRATEGLAYRLAKGVIDAALF